MARASARAAHAVARLFSVALFMGGPPSTHSDGPSTRTDLAMFLFLVPAKPKDRLSAGTCLGKIGTMMGFTRRAAGSERKRILEKQGGHHYPPRPDDSPPMDDTDPNTDKVIKPSRRKP